MIDKMPEVGDVWELYGVKNYVLQHDEKTVRVGFLYHKRFNVAWYMTKNYIKVAKYIKHDESYIDELCEKQTKFSKNEMKSIIDKIMKRGA